MNQHSLPVYAWVDTHCHLFEARYQKVPITAAQLYYQAIRNGAAWLCNVGIDVPSSQTVVATAAQLTNCYAAVGIHPHAAQKTQASDLQVLEKLASAPKVVAIGEIGLDYYYLNSPKTAQQQIFHHQLALATAKKLPVLLHIRDAFADLRQILSNYPVSGIAHCFTGSLEDAQWLIQRGFKISVSGIITFPNAQKLQNVIQQLPLSALVLETDAPYLAPQAFRGQINYPHYLRETAQKVAELKNLPLKMVLQITTANACRILRVPHL